jgi:hypothetical protein
VGFLMFDLWNDKLKVKYWTYAVRRPTPCGRPEIEPRIVLFQILYEPNDGGAPHVGGGLMTEMRLDAMMSMRLKLDAQTHSRRRRGSRVAKFPALVGANEPLSMCRPAFVSRQDPNLPLVN